MGMFGEGIYGHVGEYKDLYSNIRNYEKHEDEENPSRPSFKPMPELLKQKVISLRGRGKSDDANQVIMLNHENRGYAWTLWTGPQRAVQVSEGYSHFAYWEALLSVLGFSEEDLVYYPFLSEDESIGGLRKGVFPSRSLDEIKNNIGIDKGKYGPISGDFAAYPWKKLAFYVVENLKKKNTGFLCIMVPEKYKGEQYQIYCRELMSRILDSIPDGLRNGLSFATNPSSDLEGRFGIVFQGEWVTAKRSSMNELHLENMGNENFLKNCRLSQGLKGLIKIWNEREEDRKQIREWQKIELKNTIPDGFDIYESYYKRHYEFPKSLKEMNDYLVKTSSEKEKESAKKRYIENLHVEGKSIKDKIKEEGLLPLQGTLCEFIKSIGCFCDEYKWLRETKETEEDFCRSCLESLQEYVEQEYVEQDKKGKAIDKYGEIVDNKDDLKSRFGNHYAKIADFIVTLRNNAWKEFDNKLPKKRDQLTKEAIDGWGLDELRKEYERLNDLDTTICGDSDLNIKKVKEEDSGHQGERQNSVLCEYTSTEAWCDRISYFEVLKAIYQLLDNDDEKHVLERLNEIPDGDIPVQKAVIYAIVKHDWKQITTVVFKIYTKCQSFRAWEERDAFEDKKTGFVNECLEWVEKAKEAEISVIIRCARNIIDSNVKERLYKAINNSKWLKKKVEQGSAIDIIRIALIFPQVVEELRNSDKIPEYLRDFIGLENAFYFVNKNDDVKDGMLTQLYLDFLRIIASCGTMTLYIKNDIELSEFYRRIGEYAERTKHESVDIEFNSKRYLSLGVKSIEEVLRCFIELENGNDAAIKLEIPKNVREFFVHSGLLKERKNKKKIRELLDRCRQTSSKSIEEEHSVNEIKEGIRTTHQKSTEIPERLNDEEKQRIGLSPIGKVAIILLVVSLATLALGVAKWRNTLNNKTYSEVTVSGNSHMEESGEYNERIDPTSIQGFSSDDSTISFAESISTENSDGSSLSEHEEFVDNGSMDESEVSSRKIEAARSRYADIKDANGQSLAEVLDNRDQTGDIRSIPMGDGYNIDGRENPDRDLEAIRGEDSGLLGFGFRRDNGEDLYAVWDGNEIKGYSLTDGGEIVSEKVFDESGNLLGHDLDHDGRADIGIDLDHTIS